MLGFCCTAVMNIMTWEGVYCVFPRATLVCKETVSCNGGDLGRRMMRWRAKYKERGWMFVGPGRAFGKVRYVGDRLTLKLGFSNGGSLGGLCEEFRFALCTGRGGLSYLGGQFRSGRRSLYIAEVVGF